MIRVEISSNHLILAEKPEEVANIIKTPKYKMRVRKYVKEVLRINFNLKPPYIMVIYKIL